MLISADCTIIRSDLNSQDVKKPQIACQKNFYGSPYLKYEKYATAQLQPHSVILIRMNGNGFRKQMDGLALLCETINQPLMAKALYCRQKVLYSRIYFQSVISRQDYLWLRQRITKWLHSLHSYIITWHQKVILIIQFLKDLGSLTKFLINDHVLNKITKV